MTNDGHLPTAWMRRAIAARIENEQYMVARYVQVIPPEDMCPLGDHSLSSYAVGDMGVSNESLKAMARELLARRRAMRGCLDFEVAGDAKC